MAFGGFTAIQCINYNMEVTLEPQQRRTYNAVEITMNTAVGPLVSNARQIPVEAWDQTVKPGLLGIGAFNTGWRMDAEEVLNKFQPPNRNDKTREDIMGEAGFYWDEGGQLCHMGARVEGNEPLYGRAAWNWVEMYEPHRLLSRYEPDALDVKALEARMSFIEKEMNGQIRGAHLQETERLHAARKDVMRNIFKYVRNLETLGRDV